MIITKNDMGRRFRNRVGDEGVVLYVAEPYTTKYPVMMMLDTMETDCLTVNGTLMDGRESLSDIVEWLDDEGIKTVEWFLVRVGKTVKQVRGEYDVYVEDSDVALRMFALQYSVVHKAPRYGDLKEGV
jgi:hypothetical protein